MRGKGFLPTKGEDETFFEENANWALLRGFGSSGFATTTAIMPFVGYLILYNDQITPYLGGLGGLLDQQPSAQQCPQYIPFFTKLNFFYLGSFTLGVSALIFKCAAPRELKRYRDANEFIENERAHLTARRVRSMYRTVNSRRPRIGSELLAKAAWLSSSTPINKASIEFSHIKNDDLVLDLMRTFFQAQDRHYRRLAVVLCLVLLSAGGVMLAIPSGAFTLRVLCTIFS
ncbi:MAG: hypothetical protein HWE26_14945 [Alteromonadaceae bacterium]|nr:hypothetical protein [Alteromonadaceae bacterium]